MEKSKLMKRYEEKMDLKKDSIKMQYVYDRFIEGFEEFAQEEYDALQSENTRLKAQLTWRPVSEKPESMGMYLAEVRPYMGNVDVVVTTVYFNGESFLGYDDVVRWLPIPPAPEGE